METNTSATVSHANQVVIPNVYSVFFITPEGKKKILTLGKSGKSAQGKEFSSYPESKENCLTFRTENR